MADFVPLHVHTDYSMLDGACRVKDLAAAAAAMKMPAVAITDHGNMCGAVEFYLAMTDKQVKPILGTEFYLAPSSRFDRNSRDPHAQGFHLVLLAENMDGYRNLCRLNTAAYLEGYYYKPRIDKELLAKHSDGLICLTACIGGEVPKRILEGADKKATQALSEYLDIFGRDRLFLEIQDHGMPEEAQANRRMLELAAANGLKVVATNDSHYLKKEHAAAHEVLLCIGTQTNLSDPKRMRFSSNEFYFKSGDEMAALFASSCPEAVSNTLLVAERCSLKFDLKANHYPVFTPPNGIPREEYLRHLCLEAMKERYGFDPAGPNLSELEQTRMRRLDHELNIIGKTGFISYFLVVWDFLDFARKAGIPIGPGRGSGAGSVVAYLLHITDLDPLRYGLLFERFLNPDRVSPPDFDIDICERRRQEVIAYVKQKYGSDSVAQIGTFGTLKPKAVIKDVARALGRPFADGNMLTKLVPEDPKMTLDKALHESPELAAKAAAEPWVQEIITHSLVLEGLNRNMSIHAAGVIIGDQPLTNLVPLCLGAEKEVITQFTAPIGEKLGLLKMDFLGLRTLTIIQDALDLIKLNRGIDIDITTIPLDDQKTFQLLSRGDTVAVFQLESTGFQDTCRKMGVGRFEDISALLAIYRPGPMQFVPEYCDRKFGRVKIDYDHPDMIPVLEETYGIMLYQEQVMQVVQCVAGFSLGQADILRRAMGKKKKEEMEKMFANFVEGCAKFKNIPKDVAEAIWEKIKKFAEYGFNKSHSAAYGMVTYRTAYLKAHYPVEYLAAVLTSELGNAEKLAFNLRACRDMKIAVHAPDVNTSGQRFSVDGDIIRFGIGAIKGVGESAAEAIIEARKSGPFTSLSDFCERTSGKVNKRVMECLVKTGAFDRFNQPRAQILAMLDSVMAKAQQAMEDRVRGQGSLFDFGLGGDSGAKSGLGDLVAPDIPEWPIKEKLGYEKELLGFYVTGHPINAFSSLLDTYQTEAAGALDGVVHDTPVRLGGILTAVSEKRNKKDNRPWAILTVEGLDGVTECLLFSDKYPPNVPALVPDTPVLIEGFVSIRNEGETPKIMVEAVIPLLQAPERLTSELHVRIRQDAHSSRKINELRQLSNRHAGTTPMLLCGICESGDIAFVRPDDAVKICHSMDFRAAVQDLFGTDCLVAKTTKLPVKQQRFFDRSSRPRQDDA